MQSKAEQKGSSMGQWTQTHAETHEKKLAKQIKIGRKQANYFPIALFCLKFFLF